MYGTVLVVFLGGFLVIYRSIYSPFGQVLKSIRENEARAISLGYDTARYKYLAFVLSATLAGLAGATKAIVFQLASLTDVHWSMSGEVVLITLLGGMGTVFGPVIGAIALLVLEEALPILIGGASQLLTGHEVQGAREYWQLILGPMLLLIVLFARGGIDGLLTRPPREVKGHG
jgi:ABC-type branched-subunit amino acid transport system permease subunit